MSMFNPDTFLATSYTEANSTTLTPVPEGEYVAILGKPKARQFSGTKDPGAMYTSLDINCEIDLAGQYPSIAQQIGRDKANVRFSCMLDMTEDGTGLDMGKGKNVGLGRLREAADLNVPGAPFSFAMFEGRPVKVSVKHRVVDDRIFDEVKAVAKL